MTIGLFAEACFGMESSAPVTIRAKIAIRVFILFSQAEFRSTN